MSCLAKISDTTPRISWTHNDPESKPQTGYQVQIDRSTEFNSNSGNPDYDSGDVTSLNQHHDISPALTVAGQLYVRVRTRNADSVIGEGIWVESNYFILDPTIDTSDTTPVFYFTIPSDSDEDSLGFRIQVDTTGDFTSPLLDKASSVSQTGWEYNNGVSWVSFPSGGVPSTYYGNQARYTVQTGDALTTPQVYAFRVRAEEA